MRVTAIKQAVIIVNIRKGDQYLTKNISYNPRDTSGACRVDSGKQYATQYKKKLQQQKQKILENKLPSIKIRPTTLALA